MRCMVKVVHVLKSCNNNSHLKVTEIKTGSSSNSFKCKI